ncbi:MAG: penicillin acylase family protein [Candidatus Hodarchaeales archaeon]|jgi:penicillin amidase
MAIFAETESNPVVKLGLSLIPVLLIIVVFSTPLGLVPPLGGILNPNGGIWDVSTYAEHGSKTLTIPNVEEEVICYYDEWGVPHIFAETDSDMFFTIGYVHARDRLFQLEMVRRLYTGRISEIIGESALSADIQMRNLCLDRAANTTWNLMLADNPESNLVKSLEKYTEGINYYIDHLSSHELPLEFRLLNAKPSHWLPHYTIGYGKYMSMGLAHDGFRDFTVALLGSHFPESELLELFPINNTVGVIPVLPNYGSYPSPPTPPGSAPDPIQSEATDVESSLPESVISSMLAIMDSNDISEHIVINDGYTVEDYLGVFDTILGSNNWVINGSVSSTGYPILANDMHLQLVMPGVWYEMQHASEESGTNVYGFSFVGAPGVIAGHSKYASWGFTNVGADVVDYFYYNASADGTKYLNGSTWEDFQIVTETIPVKGAADHELTIRFTGHGPVISPDINSHVEAANYAPIAMRWTGHDDLMSGNPDYLFKAVFSLWNARTLEDFAEAQRDWSIPGQNFVVATTDNHIAIRPIANYPIRPKGNWGRKPVNGSDPANDWVGYIPFDELAIAEDPAQQFLSSTNQKTTGPDYPYFMGSFFAPGYRSRSITKLIQDKIDASEKISVEDMQTFQSDIVDTSIEAFQPVWSTIDTLGNTTLQKALEYMHTWGGASYRFGEMHRDLVAPTIYTEWLEFFRYNTFADEFAEAHEEVRTTFPQDNTLENMTLYNQSVKWFDDIATPEIETIEDIAYQSLVNAVDFLATPYGLNTVNMDDWIYGSYHTLFPLHLTELSPLNAGPYPFYGNRYTLAAASGRTVHHGASERAVYDLDPAKCNLPHAWTSIPSGQNGNPLSKHYKDQLETLYIVRTNDRFGYHVAHFYTSAAEFKAVATMSSSDSFFIESTLTFQPGG